MKNKLIDITEGVGVGKERRRILIDKYVYVYNMFRISEPVFGNSMISQALYNADTNAK